MKWKHVLENRNYFINCYLCWFALKLKEVNMKEAFFLLFIWIYLLNLFSLSSEFFSLGPLNSHLWIVPSVITGGVKTDMKLVGFPGDPIQTLMKMKIMSERGGKEVMREHKCHVLDVQFYPFLLDSVWQLVQLTLIWVVFSLEFQQKPTFVSGLTFRCVFTELSNISLLALWAHLKLHACACLCPYHSHAYLFSVHLHLH